MSILSGYPEVAHAYQPARGATLSGAVVMLVCGLPVAVAGGYLLAKVSTPGNRMLPDLLSLLVGGALPWVVRTASRWGHNRSRVLAGVCGALCGAACTAVVFVQTAGSLTVVATVIIGVLSFTMVGAVGDPYCVAHRRFMERLVIRRLSLDVEHEAMRALEAERYRQAADMTETTSHEDRCDLTLEYCPACLDGYVSMTVHMTEQGGLREPSSRGLVHSRRQYSARVVPSVVTALRGLGDPA